MRRARTLSDYLDRAVRINSGYSVGDDVIMAGKFLSRGAIIDTIKSEQRTNAIQKRDGLKKHPVRVTSCGCPDPNCGCWHTILTDRTIPTDEVTKQLLAEDKKKRKYLKPHKKHRKSRADNRTPRDR